jgi:hypothetical protein
MIDCPKCGFYQPKDRYCAKCGIDMEQFYVKPKPFYFSILNNAWTYIVILLLVTSTLGILISMQPNSKLARTAKSWVLKEEASNNLTFQNEVLNNDLKEDSSFEPETQNRENHETQSISNPELQHSSLSLNDANPSPEEKLDTPINSSLPENIEINFLQISKRKFESIYSQLQIISDSGETQIFNLKKENALDFFKKMGSGIEILPGRKEFNPKKNKLQILNFNYGEDVDEDNGMSIHLEFGQRNLESINFDYEILINLKGDKNTPPFNNTIEGSYSLNSKSSIIFVGVLPKIKLSSDSLQNLSTTPLKIFENDEFTDPDAQEPVEFLILISVK